MGRASPPQNAAAVASGGSSESGRHRVVIVGGGFAGLYAAKGLDDEAIELTVVDRRNFHLFQPLLYQVATGALAAGEISQPLRSILRGQANTEVVLGEAVELDVDDWAVILSDGARIPYDTLVVATGAHHAYFGHDEWATVAPGLKSVEDALEIRRRILLAFETAEREDDPAERLAWMSFVVVGGGPTGVELAGALGEIAHDTLRRDFRRIDPTEARITLVEGLDRILPTYPAGLSRSAARQLVRLGVTVRPKTMVEGIDDRGVMVRAGGGDGSAAPERIAARTVLWAAGVQAASFGRRVAAATGVTTDRAGRFAVEADLGLPGHPEILALGDLAIVPWRPAKPVPGVAPAAIQEGRYAARAIKARAHGQPVPPFHYTDKGDVAVIGRLAGVCDIRWLGPIGRQSGFPAWLLWLGIHLSYLIGFSNRAVVLTRWAWSFVTHGRGSRLITGAPRLPSIEPSNADDA
ncbi:MAG: NAD(P)/FAD-dependent oxidoreductase [Candidatus Limnocylindrales bacterium]